MRILLAFFVLGFCLSGFSREETRQNSVPNVILILTDDQGIGDLSCHGNPWIKTPNIDAFYGEAVRLTDFHVSPVCTPTRGAIMTGRYPINNGAWATYKGRDALSEGALTMAHIFNQNGYKTGMFGKWHLGDNYPVRPTDCGFDVAVRHMAGGVGELSDYWGNNYFNDVYDVNNEPRQFEGYCTDVWFQEAMKFMESSKEEAFFVYLPTNAPHDPLYVADKYSEPYKALVGEEIVSAAFYGMISNIDENFGRLREFLVKNELLDNTILIFMSDNGTANGISGDGKIGYNMGLRGKKGAKTEGGHRVPFFIAWKNGKIGGGWDVEEACAHVDILPTLAALCNLNIPPETRLDGLDLSSLLLKKEKTLVDRSIFVHHRQDWRPPEPVDKSCIIHDKWRLVNGDELYDVDKDRMQEENLAEFYPGVVEKMLNDNSEFLMESITNREYKEFPVHVIGHVNQEEIKLTIQHAIGEDPGIWKSEQVAAGMKNRNNTHALRVDREGTYLISCKRWPSECPGPVLGIPAENPKNWFSYQSIHPEKVRIQIGNQIIEKKVEPDDFEVVFKVHLERGNTFLVNDFIEGQESYGVYYTYIKPDEQGK